VLSGGWQRIALGEDVFAQATVLRVLARCAAPDTIDAGITALKSAANQDGWGPGPRQSTTIEATATVLLALAACGENRFVPYRIATARLTAAIETREALQSELATLRQDLARQVTTESGKILADRDKWRSEAQQQLRRIDELEDALRTAQRDALEQTRRAQELLHQLARRETSSFMHPPPAIGWAPRASISVVLVALMVSVFGTSVLFYGVGSIRINILGLEIPSRVIGLSTVAAGMLVFVTFLIQQVILLRWDRVLRVGDISLRVQRSQEPVTFMVGEYSDIASIMPPVIREELNYLLFSRIADMPKDVGLRFARDTLDRLGVPESYNERILVWIANFLQMDSFERRAVVEQIRRQSQPT
jgi:hypothetical protein